MESDIRKEMRQIAEKIAKSDAKHRELLKQRDEIARRAASEGITWREMQDTLGLSIRGLQLVLGRTK